MLRLSAGSRRLSGSEFQVDGPAIASKTPTTKTVQTITLTRIRYYTIRNCSSLCEEANTKSALTV